MCESNSLLRQNQELRDRLNEDAAVYRRRIDTYRQAQQNQAALVARLQSKVLQYKRKYSDLEERMCDVPGTSEMAGAIKVNVCHWYTPFLAYIVCWWYLIEILWKQNFLVALFVSPLWRIGVAMYE